MSSDYRWRHEISSQDEGEAHLVYRIPATAESLAEFEAWLALVLRKVRREAVAIHRASVGDPHA